MFTGIIEEIGKIEKITPIAGGITLKLKAEKILEDIRVNDSVCIDGVCLTVTNSDKSSFWVDAVGATLEKTTFKKVKADTSVNLERSVRLERPTWWTFSSGTCKRNWNHIRNKKAWRKLSCKNSNP